MATKKKKRINDAVFQIRLPVTLHARFKRLTERRDTTMGKVLRDFIERWCKRPQ